MLLFPLLLALAAPATLTPTPPGPAAIPAQAPPPNIVTVASITPEDAGSLPVGSLAVRQVRFTNLAAVPLRLRVVEKSCACLDTKFGADLLAPGEATELTFHTIVAPGGMPVRYCLVVEAASDDPAKPTLRSRSVPICIQYESSETTLVKPQTVIIRRPSGDNFLARVAVRQTDEEAGRPEIQSVSVDADWAQATVVPSDSIPHLAWVELFGKLPPGRNAAKLTINMADGGRHHVRVRTIADPLLHPAPSLLTLTRTAPGKAAGQLILRGPRDLLDQIQRVHVDSWPASITPRGPAKPIPQFRWQFQREWDITVDVPQDTYATTLVRFFPKDADQPLTEVRLLCPPPGPPAAYPPPPPLDEP